MTSTNYHRIVGLGAALAATAFLTACSGGGGASGSVSSEGEGALGTGNTSKDFDISKMDVIEGQVWEVNRPIRFGFTKAVDFATVNFNTIEISILDPASPLQTGLPATGVFTLLDEFTVEFQPTCPTVDDFTDAGFLPGGFQYRIQVLGLDSSPLTVRSVSNEFLESSQVRTFTTPVTLTPQVLFIDLVPGPPIPVIRGDFNGSEIVSLSEDQATRIEVNQTPFDAGFITFTGAEYTIPTDQPLNLYSSPDEQVSFVVEINQPVNPASTNINSENIFLEVEVKGAQVAGTFQRIPTLVDLERNCTESGATIRLSPQGVLPQDSRVRAVIDSGFQDLTGDTNLLSIDDRIALATEVVDNSPLVPSDTHADAYHEEFDIAGGSLGSFEDLVAAFSEPRAQWGDGVLKAAFNFDGDGGPGGDFDLLVPSNTTINLNTVSATVTGGPNALSGAPSTTQAVINGKLNVRNLRIDPGATLQAVGPNPLVIQATGTVELRGVLSVDGGNGKNVATLNTGHQPETGGAGNAGGGRGGTASFLTTTSTPKGGDANGAFDIPDLGGIGGESGFGTGGKNNRRPGGGGGGRLGANENTSQGMSAEPGHNGNINATGAIYGQKPPKGGPAAPGPFVDEDENNNFFGNKFNAGQGTLIFGELESVWGGSGGGAGGDAVPGAVFPTPNWNPGSNEKGAGGGGGAGGVMILALGDVIFGSGGLIKAEGGHGGSGENTIYNDHVGGGSGGGSGGHVVIQARTVDFTDGGTIPSPPHSPQPPIDARGGKAGGGQNGVNSTNAGGDGGPGLVQVHVAIPQLDLQTGTKTLAQLTRPNALSLSPLFGSESRAISKWIPLGGAVPATFTFGGIDPGTGLVLDADQNEIIDDLDPLLGPTALVDAPGIPSIAIDGRTLSVDVSSLNGTADDIYLRNPELLVGFALDLGEISLPTNRKRFEIESASYDGGLELLSVTVSSTGPTLSFFLAASLLSPGEVEFTLVPRFFTVTTGGEDASLPASASIEIQFEGTVQDATGLPVDPPTVGVTSDFSALNAQALDFVRFQVRFDIDADQGGLTADSPRPELRFFKLPFLF